MWWYSLFSSVSSSILFFFFFFFFFCFCFCVVSGVSFFLDWDVLMVGSCSFQFSLVGDWMSLSFGSLVLFISASVLMFTSSYMADDFFLRRFVWLVLLFVVSMCMLIFIPNFVALLLGWDGLGLVSFLLVIYYQNYKSLGAGMLTVLANRIGDVMILLSIGWCVSQGHWNVFCFDVDSLSPYVVFCVLVAGMTKSAQVPFSSWLPAAMAAPTPVSALVHSSTLVTAGVYLLVRFSSFLFELSWFCPCLLVVSVLTMFMAGICANVESDMKKVIALSTLSQLGVMMFSLSLGMVELTVFHLYTHALFKAMLFLCAGAVIHCCQHAQDFRFMGGLWGQLPFVVSCLNVANLALCGAPFLAGFYSKDLILEMCLFFGGGWVMLFLVFFATGLTAAYSVRFSVLSLWGEFKFFPFHNLGDEDWLVVFPIAFLTFGAIFGGSAFGWLYFSGFSVVLPFYLKILAVFVTFLGVVFGGVISSGVRCVVEVTGGGFFSFGFAFMWFLVVFSTQVLLWGGLPFFGGFLYLLDRGWVEVFGGRGSFFSVSSGGRGVQLWQEGGLFIHVGLFLVSFVLGVCFFIL